MEVMVLVRVRSVFAVFAFVTLLCTSLCTSLVFADEVLTLEPGVHQIDVFTQSFEVETEDTIELTFDFVDEFRVTGHVTVIDPVGAGWVTLTWLNQSVVLLDQVIEGSANFEHQSSETGHAERNKAPKYGPTIRQRPPLD